MTQRWRAADADLTRPWVFYRIGSTVMRFLVRRTGRVEVSGRENIPAHGTILVANHIGWLDPVWLGAVIWPRPAFFMGKQELFRGLLGKYLLAMGVFPVDRTKPGPSSLKRPVEIVRRGGIVIVFPSGTRAAEVTALKRGAATIAVLSGCPILPVIYTGPARPTLSHFLRRPPVSVRFLPPLYPQTDLPGGAKAEVPRLSLCLEALLEGN